MKLTITIDGRDHTLELPRNDEIQYQLDGTPFKAEVAEVEAGVYSFLIGAKSFQVRVAPSAGESATGLNDNGDYTVDVSGLHYAVTVKDPRSRRTRREAGKQTAGGTHNIAARMPGKVVRVLVSEGQAVEHGQGLVVVEAMKMQNEIKCPTSGKIAKVFAREGQPVNTGESLFVIVSD